MKNRIVLTTKKWDILNALRIAGDCAWIIVPGCVLVERYEKFIGRKKKACLSLVWVGRLL
jgi:hypothetical protein